MSQNKPQTPTYAQRVSALEQNFTFLQMALQQQLQNISNMANTTGEVLGNLLKVLVTKGIVTEAELQKQAEDTRKELAAETLKKSRDAVTKLLEDGQIRVAEKLNVESESIVVVAHYAADGTRAPDQIVASKNIADNIKPLLNDKGVGDSVDMPNGGKVEVLEIYEMVPRAELEEALAAKEAAAVAPAAEAVVEAAPVPANA